MSNLAHKLLVAMPHIKDELFEKSVIYVYEHDDQGAMAFVINKLLPISMGDILRQLNMELPSFKANELFLLQGGPVSKEQLYVVQFGPTSNGQLMLAQPQDLLHTFAKGEQLENTLPFLGYAGWSAGQLEKELINNDWLICPFSSDVFSNVQANERWEYCFRKIGVNPLYLSADIGHA
ncbi:MAG: YqgE/AlgH family protein [Gammaproteobacteria bacterium]|nr:YqgE/AlgH family protein [Gammaproteobacteria bacterium]